MIIGLFQRVRRTALCVAKVMKKKETAQHNMCKTLFPLILFHIK